MSIPFARTLERKYEFLKWFDGGIFSGDVQLIKPEPEIYALLESRYQLQAAETIFIDDLLVNIEAAKARGWHGIHFESAAQVSTDVQTLLS
jgi:putative hydrolase of the HAD superfamily